MYELSCGRNELSCVSLGSGGVSYVSSTDLHHTAYIFIIEAEFLWHFPLLDTIKVLLLELLLWKCLHDCKSNGILKLCSGIVIYRGRYEQTL